MSGTPLSRSVGRGLRWNIGNNVVSRLGTFLVGLVLARLLVPEDYGEFTVALVALLLIVNVNDLGMETTLVRWPGDVDEIGPTATTMIFLTSCAFALVVVLGAPAFASAMGAPSATGIVQLLAVAVVINGATAVPSGLLTRDFRQDKRMAADLAGFVVGAGTTVGLAATGHGAWSLAWGRIAGNGVTSGLHVVFAPTRYRPGWSPGVARLLVRHGPPVAGTTLLAVMMLNVDYVIVGRVLGAASLGLYLMAFNLSSWPVNMFSTAAQNVAVPGFARLAGLGTAARARLLAGSFAAWFTVLLLAAVPVAVILAVGAAPVLSVLYGENWVGAAPALTFLALLGVARVAFHYCADFLVALGRGPRAFRLQTVWLVVLVPVLAVAARIGGIEGVGVGHIVVAVVVMAPLFLRAVAREGVTWAALRGAASRPLVAGAVAAVAAIGVRWSGAHLGWSAFAQAASVTLVVLAAVGAITLPARAALLAACREADLDSPEPDAGTVAGDDDGLPGEELRDGTTPSVALRAAG